MKNLIIGLAALPLVSATALAQPVVQLSGPARQPSMLTETQMDAVTAGWSLTELEASNTSITAVAVYGTPPAPMRALDAIVAFGNDPACDTCYLFIASPAISVASVIRGGLSTTIP